MRALHEQSSTCWRAAPSMGSESVGLRSIRPIGVDGRRPTLTSSGLRVREPSIFQKQRELLEGFGTRQLDALLAGYRSAEASGQGHVEVLG